ncbi:MULTISPECIES: hypothetical protein [unclassified Endozoicomonas]|uniref:hypothetical protein n=2 Tax=unclassified Endozoicomonas TaxID=2644528 RepID=UPI0021489234|nr:MULTISPECIES: hypothetical protein [unclassified Endozoicomonas]
MPAHSSTLFTTMNTYHATPNQYRSCALSLVITCLIFTLLCHANELALNYVIQSALEEYLPDALNAALVNSYDKEELLKRSAMTLKAWIESANIISLANISMFSDIEVLEISLTPKSSPQDSDLSFYLNKQAFSLDWQISVVHSEIALLLMATLSALAGLVFYLQLHRTGRPAQIKSATNAVPENKPISSEHEITADSSEVSGVLTKNTEPASPHVSSVTKAALNLSKHTVSIGDNTLEMSKTPFFYYYWYAKRSLDGLPAYINPCSTRPDTDKGHELAQIMRSYRGHARAINELEQHGLKARTLDQNRNKIKEEMRAHFGDLAQAYLFVKSRDQKTGRYQHALMDDNFLIKTIS